ncbi:MAG: PAS domain S-box protein [Thaumarchaeota archaeon]|nr:PAS domain S-box protein [Nitrososphaerota archaeon]
MAKFFSSYYQKLLIINLILSLVPMIIISSYLYSDKINDEIKTLEEKLLFVSNSEANNVGLWIEERNNNVNDIAKNELILAETKKLLDDDTNEDESFIARFNLEKQLQTSVATYRWLQELRISDPKTGNGIFSTSIIPPTVNYMEDDHFQQALKKNTATSEIFPARMILKNEYGEYEKDVPTLLISAPITGEVGVEGILTARVNVFALNSIINKVINDFATADSYLINSDGYFISESKFRDYLLEQNLIKKRSQLELQVVEPNSNKFTKIFQNAEKDETYVDLSGYKNYRGNDVVGAITPIKNTNWSYIVEVDKQEAYLEITKLQITLLTIIYVIVIIIIIISILFAKTLVDPITSITKIVQKFGMSESWNVEDELKFNHGRTNEIANLYQTFKTMTESIKKSINTIKFAEQKYRALYDDLPDLCRTINKDGIILDCNKAYAKNLGYTKDKIIGKSIFKHAPKDSMRDLRNSFETWRKSGAVSNREIKLKRKDGTTFPVLVSATNLYDTNDQLIGSNTIIKDISELHTLLEVDKAKDEFSSMISHELKTPLIPIMGYCEMLRDPKFFGKLTEPQLEVINEIYDNTTRLNTLISEVMKAQKLELNRLTIKKEIFEVGEFLETIIKNHTQLMISKQITFTSNYSSNSKVMIKTDKDRLHEVFTNLIQNAVDFVPEQNGKIEVGATDNGKSILFYVKDNGIGIPSDKIGKLFTKFYQIDTSFSRKHGGSGLGLVICKGIVTALGGEIKAESKVCEGTTFSFDIPKGDKNE